MEKILPVVVPVLWVMSSVLNASEIFVEEVAAEKKLERAIAVVEAEVELDTSKSACGEVVPMPRYEKAPVLLLYASGNAAERLDELILLLKSDQSVCAR